MANRSLLPKSKLGDFKKWIENQGYMVVPTSKNIYEVFHAKKGNDTIIIYEKKGSKEHYSIADKDLFLVKRFLKECKREKKERLINAYDLISHLEDYALQESPMTHDGDGTIYQTIKECIRAVEESPTIDRPNSIRNAHFIREIFPEFTTIKIYTDEHLHVNKQTQIKEQISDPILIKHKNNVVVCAFYDKEYKDPYFRTCGYLRLEYFDGKEILDNPEACVECVEIAHSKKDKETELEYNEKYINDQWIYVNEMLKKTYL